MHSTFLFFTQHPRVNNVDSIVFSQHWLAASPILLSRQVGSGLTIKTGLMEQYYPLNLLMGRLST